MYGLIDCCDYWRKRFETICKVHLQSCICDDILLFKQIGNRLIVMCATSVDDSFHGVILNILNLQSLLRTDFNSNQDNGTICSSQVSKLKLSKIKVITFTRNHILEAINHFKTMHTVGSFDGK